jgi:hypothetical protein
MRGYAKPETLKDFEDSPVKELVGGHKLVRGDFKKYFTDDFWQLLYEWRRYKVFGLPYQKPWSQHPANLIKGLFLFEEEHQAALSEMQAEEMEKRKR